MPPPQLQFTKELDEIEAELASLKVAYEQYFIGLERRAPDKRREDLRHRIMRQKEVFMKNTGIKFRMNSLQQKYLSYERMWMRTLKEIEEGTYARDLFKARLHSKLRSEKEAPAAASNGTQGPAQAREQAAQQPLSSGPSDLGRAPPVADGDLALAAAVAASAKRKAAAATVLAEDRVKSLYDTYLAAKQRCNESTTGLTPETLAATLRKQIPSLLQKHNAKEIDFKVVIKGGKAVLKAVPKA